MTPDELSFADALDQAVAGMGVIDVTSSIFPWKSYKYTSSSPQGIDQAVKKLTEKALAAIAPLIVSGAKGMGVRFERVCVTLVPADPKPGKEELAYMKRLGGPGLDRLSLLKKKSGGVAGLGADDDIGQLAQKAAVDAAVRAAAEEVVKQAAIQTGVATAGQAVPFVNIASVAANVVMDPKAAWGTTEAKVTTTATMGAAVASCWVPVIGWFVAAGLAIKALFDYRKAKGEAKKEEARWGLWKDEFKSLGAVLVAEAKPLAAALVSRGVAVHKGSGAALEKHYFAQLRNHQISHKQELSTRRQDWARLMLQAARDMRILRSLYSSMPAHMPPAQLAEIASAIVAKIPSAVKAKAKKDLADVAAAEGMGDKALVASLAPGAGGQKAAEQPPAKGGAGAAIAAGAVIALMALGK